MYERGDLELSLRLDDASTTVSYPYAVGSGVMEDPACDWCGRELTAENPVIIDGRRLIGIECCSN
jgi:hypothetical protein